MKLKQLLMVTIAISAFSCSKDDTIDREPQQIQKANFRVVGEDLNSVYLFSYDGSNESSISENLTEELGVQPDYLTLRELNGLLSFFSFSGGAFSLAQKNIITGELSNFDSFFANGPGRSVVWGTSNSSNVFFGYFTPGIVRNIAIQDIDLTDLSAIDIIIDLDIETLFQPIQYNERLYLSYRDTSGDYKLTFYDIPSKIIGPIISFNEVPISILIDDIGDLAVIKNGNNAIVETYDSETLSFLNRSELNFNSGFSAGPVENATISEEKLYYARPFVQPSLFAAGPAIFDFNTQEDTLIDLFGIVNEVEEELGVSISISSQSFSKSQNVFFISYAVLSDEVQGGVIQIATDGTLIANVTFPFLPNAILKD